MRAIRRLVLFLLLTISFALTARLLFAQQVIATIPVNFTPWKVALNPATNKIYVASATGGLVTVIDGATNNTTPVNLANLPYAIAVNPVTNKIYVALPIVGVVVIDGATNNTTTIVDPNGIAPWDLAVNSVTNKIYAVNIDSNNVTVIDGANNQVTADVNVGTHPEAVAVNTVTNRIYVTNHGYPADGNTVTVIDGANNNTSTVGVGSTPYALAVNPVTNTIYVANEGDGTVTVIDGTTNRATATITVGTDPEAVGVNAVTNKIYVANHGDDITVIDGSNNNTTTLPDPHGPHAVAVDAVRDQIYVGDPNPTLQVIDGATNGIVTLSIDSDAASIAVNPVTNRAYVADRLADTVSVIAGATNSVPLQFDPVAPCRLVDTRPEKGGSGPILGGASRNFPVPQEGGCNIPTTAAAYSLNVSVVPSGPLGYLTIWPTGDDQPVVATLNSLDGRIKADAAIVPAGYQGAVTVFVTQTTNVILDINGYFTPASPSTLAFYPLPPCRVADTRKTTFPLGLGSPFLPGLQERDFPILSAASCNIPTTAAAYSLNFSVVPHGPLGYMTVWPTGQSRPTVSTLNDIPGTIIANAAIVPAGMAGDISVYPSNDTDVIIDINGYFAPPGTGGLSLYAAAPCRVIDTRKVGMGLPVGGMLNPPVDVMDSVCGPSAAARAYVLNATVVPFGALGYLTLWQNDPMHQPVVSTLNALDGAITNNMAIVPTADGKIDAYASGITQLILDISSYFAP
jgi:YVTN family beta-propeller protein